MRQFISKFTVATTFTLLAFGMFVGAQSIPEAPAGFDGKTNGSIDQTTMDTDSAQFQEQETVTENGVGPTYNDVACVNCHQNQAVGGAAQVLEFRAGHDDFTRPSWFRSFRHRGDTNGSVGTFVAATAVLANGSKVPERSLVNQRAICPDAQEHVTNADYIRATRLALPLFGDGFVEAVPDATFTTLAKANGGEAIQVPVLEASDSTTEIGKFGWKDQHASLLSFSSDAYLNEMGVTNRLNPTEATTVCNPNAIAEPNNLEDDIDQFAEFMRALKVPPRGLIDDKANAGQVLFEQIGCTHCHVETLQTAAVGTFIHGGLYKIPPGIGGVQFHPFGDFLLHDIGTGDGIVQNGPADTQFKVRTMPLWGLRTRTQLMHDAHSDTFADAIERHRHEAADEEAKFERLTPAQKSLLYAFLGSL